MANIYQYNGTDVRVFTNVVDNPDFQAFAGGVLTNAWYVAWFGERLNLFNPTIAGRPNPQAVLYSGIRDAAGNGDKFNTPGSGMLSADTSDYISGVNILGNFIIANFSRSQWVLEKTRDAFNPYIWRRIPSVLGTDAPFSFTQWADQVRSMGRTGIISTDSRESGRVDDKIPYFTVDDVDQQQFELTYGGFDRANGQFLFSYKDDASVSTTQDRVLVNNYEESTWSTYTQRFSVFGQTDLGQELVWNDIDETLNPSWARWDTTEEIWNKIGRTASTQKTLAGDDEGFVYQLNTDYDDYFVNITGISIASEAVVSTGNQAFEVGDRVVIAGVEGMTEINNWDDDDPPDAFIAYEVLAATLTSVTLNVNSNDFTAWSAGGTISKVIDFQAETVPFNPYRAQGRKIYIGYVEFLVNTNGGHLYVDFYMDGEETAFKSNVLIKPSGILKDRAWVTATVNQDADFFTIVMRQESPHRQVQITSVRIHARPGGVSNG
ncbi:MAG: hypothetical protein Q8O94_03530 [bacterium]|nr:hypothetical protein [bacterium]